MLSGRGECVVVDKRQGGSEIVTMTRDGDSVKMTSLPRDLEYLLQGSEQVSGATRRSRRLVDT